MPEITQEDSRLDQEYNPLPESTIVVDISDSEEEVDYNLPPRQKGRLKGSKNKLKDSAQTTIILGSETPSQTRVTDYISQESSSQESRIVPS